MITCIPLSLALLEITLLKIQLTNNSLNNLQTIQNACASFLTGTKQLQRDSVKYKSVKVSIGFLSFAVSSLSSYFQIIHPNSDNIVSDYLSSQIYAKSSARFIRSSFGPIFEVPRSCLKSVGDRSLICAVPNLWNQLPLFLHLNNSFNTKIIFFQAVLYVLISIVISVYYFYWFRFLFSTFWGHPKHIESLPLSNEDHFLNMMKWNKKNSLNLWRLKSVENAQKCSIVTILKVLSNIHYFFLPNLLNTFFLSLSYGSRMKEMK